MSVAPEGGRNRIMIYGPKPDGTYVVEFQTVEGAGDQCASQRDARAQAFPGSHALWAIRAGRSNMTGPQNSRDLRVSWSSFI